MSYADELADRVLGSKVVDPGSDDDSNMFYSTTGYLLRIVSSGEGYRMEQMRLGDWESVDVRDFAHSVFGKLCEMMAEQGVFDEKT